MDPKKQTKAPQEIVAKTKATVVASEPLQQMAENQVLRARNSTQLVNLSSESQPPNTPIAEQDAALQRDRAVNLQRVRVGVVREGESQKQKKPRNKCEVFLYVWRARRELLGLSVPSAFQTQPKGC